MRRVYKALPREKEIYKKSLVNIWFCKTYSALKILHLNAKSASNIKTALPKRLKENTMELAAKLAQFRQWISMSR